MRLAHFFVFLTFVLLSLGSVSKAAPTADLILESTKPSPQDKEATSEAFRNVKLNRSWAGSTNLTLGYFAGVRNTDQENEITPVLGLQRTQ